MTAQHHWNNNYYDDDYNYNYDTTSTMTAQHHYDENYYDDA